VSLAKEFKEFALKGNVVDLAVGVVIGGAFGKIVSAAVDDLIMPVVGAILPGGDWRAFSATPLNLKIGHLLGAILDFTIIAAVMFFVIVKLMGRMKSTLDVPAVATKPCPECTEPVAMAARRCKHCTAPIGSAASAAG
jgi:large conductance mechanosensitive channel